MDNGMDLNKYICQCGKVYYKDDEYAKWNYWVRCDCGGQAKLEDMPVRGVPMTNRIYEGWNEGLGENVRSKKHYKEIVKRNDLKEVG